MARTWRESATKSPLSRRTPHIRAAEFGGAPRAFEGVVGVDELDGGFAEDALEFAEGFQSRTENDMTQECAAVPITGMP